MFFAVCFSERPDVCGGIETFREAKSKEQKARKAGLDFIAVQGAPTNRKIAFCRLLFAFWCSNPWRKYEKEAF
ncbi:hypothetical protein L0337_32110 [candidate division KSB1 bacterium]|nr:hypothetical protein [candidate division KSB1 bacterium]